MIEETAKKVLRLEAQAIQDLIGRIDRNFSRAIGLLQKCRGRVVVTGMGKSGLIGKKIAATLASTGTPAFFLHPAEGIHGDLGMVSKDDAVVVISNSGETEELIKILPAFKRLAVPIICLTGNTRSTLAMNSDTVIDVGVKEEAGPLGLVPTASTTATLAMGDALSVALLEERGFKHEDFAYFHPGGSLGKKLLLKVSDVWHHGTAVPRVTEKTPLKDVIVEMTSKKLGMTTVVNSRGALSGIVTDGDLRRLLERDRSPMRLKASDVMTRKPKVIGPTALAAKAVQIMEQHSITSLVVVDARRKVLGVLHLHDLLKAGVV
ncbi:MAG TPA: KpsF/GutQ family sugar-phosphate isomerase [Nitrospiria bacterium]|nr:KpsF/GutQ family sugar-phosphate isomerase [Nitrospiria bacterium]HUK56818.1 KpsF/GutQ family sugar-phosphate isomerase [Nitrospiria bacterium]